MEYLVKTGDPAKQRTACLILGIHAKRRMSPAAKRIDEASDGYLSRLLRRGDIEGEAGDTLLVYEVPGISAERLLLVGCGDQKAFSPTDYRKAVSAAAGVIDNGSAREAVCCLTELTPQGNSLYQTLRDTIVSTEEKLYRFDRLKSEPKAPQRPLRKLTLWVPERGQIKIAEKAVAHGAAIAGGMALAKDLGNLPGNICTPSYLADEARKLGRRSAKLKVRVLTEAQMEKLGMGALLSVSRGSRQPAKLIVMEYKGKRSNAKPIVLVGKGLTFDAGGISLKPSANMDEMKYDMCGGASVLGTLAACVEMKLPINVVGVIPASENLPDGNANKPGDIVTSMSGQTIEVLNTDAEGRLILCDALTYSERFDPAAVIDIATLTGACIVALGKHASGLLANDNDLAQEVLDAGTHSSDRAWQLPLWDDYQSQLDSNFADMANIGGKEAGTVTAACFLSRFTKKFKWAHLDIAGSAWNSGKDKGATGRPVPLLIQFLRHRCGLEE
ncbi:MAG TPA: leucyl aminopeptidase [Chromatiales bacterium]|nr:leucyl aminopeptidase [Chromatiales bacterium]